MPGSNRTQAQLISATDLKTALDGYAMVPQKLLIDQNALLSELVRKNFKRPSVFESGTAFSWVNNYNISASDLVTQQYMALFGLDPIPVYIFNIKDADRVRIKAFSTTSSQANVQLMLAYSLSPNDASNQIPADQFSLLPPTSSLADDSNDYWTMTHEIECAGNKYLHMFGITASTGQLGNFFAVATTIAGENDPQSFLTYDLIK